MKRHLSTLGAMLLIATLIFSGCQAQQGPAIPADPVEAVKLIADKQQEIQSQHLDLNLDLTLKVSGLPADDPSAAMLNNFKATAAVGGDVDSAKQDFQFNGTADLGIFTSFLAPGSDELKFDLVKVGDTMYSRVGDQAWQESAVDTSASGGAAAADFSDLSGLLKKVARAERLGDEAIDGADSYHFKVSLDPVELLNELAKLGESAAGVNPDDLAQATELLKDSIVDLDIWIGKADLFIRQQKLYLKIDLKNIPDAPPDAAVLAEINLTSKNSKINQPVTISAPQ
ncbi:MAG TPA: hypothetical protein VJG32_18990 [Anaerolineae bacterium]|nr:hypothetical protein [Anaerolineae bacterium]